MGVSSEVVEGEAEAGLQEGEVKEMGGEEVAAAVVEKEVLKLEETGEGMCVCEMKCALYLSR